MAISLKRYTPQVKVSGEGTAVELSADLAAEAASAGSRVMQTAAEGTREIFEKIQEKRDETAIAELSDQMEIDALAFTNTISSMNDEDEINNFYEQWKEKQQQQFKNSNLSDRIKRKAEVNFNSYLNKNALVAQKRNLDIVKQKSDRIFYNLEDSAIRGVLKLNPSTEEMFTSREEQYNYAQDKLVENGTLEYDTALKNKRIFLENADDGVFKTLLQSDRV